MARKRKHCAYQPTDKEWKCPKCGSGDFELVGFDSKEPCDADVSGEGDCELLHDDDMAYCPVCCEDFSMRKFCADLQKKHNLVKCECCNGTGLVAKNA